MIETSIWRASGVGTADRRASQASPGGSSVRPWRVRLWAMLNAQALIRGGTGGGPGDVAFIEDDRQRLARRGR